jgi:hypothetical protein
MKATSNGQNKSRKNPKKISGATEDGQNARRNALAAPPLTVSLRNMRCKTIHAKCNKRVGTSLKFEVPTRLHAWWNPASPVPLLQSRGASSQLRSASSAVPRCLFTAPQCLFCSPAAPLHSSAVPLLQSRGASSQLRSASSVTGPEFASSRLRPPWIRLPCSGERWNHGSCDPFPMLSKQCANANDGGPPRGQAAAKNPATGWHSTNKIRGARGGRHPKKC